MLLLLSELKKGQTNVIQASLTTREQLKSAERRLLLLYALEVVKVYYNVPNRLLYY